MFFVPLGHESDAFAHTIGDFFGGMFVDDIGVTLGQHWPKAQIDFLLANPRLAFASFHRHPARFEMTANRADNRFFAGTLQDVVILVVIARGFEVVVVFGVGLGIGIIEQVEFDFTTTKGFIPHLLSSIDLVAQYLPRRYRNSVMIIAGEITQHHGGFGEPGGQT